MPTDRHQADHRRLHDVLKPNLDPPAVETGLQALLMLHLGSRHGLTLDDQEVWPGFLGDLLAWHDKQHHGHDVLGSANRLTEFERRHFDDASEVGGDP
jgi:hypothetical protein